MKNKEFSFSSASKAQRVQGHLTSLRPAHRMKEVGDLGSLRCTFLKSADKTEESLR